MGYSRVETASRLGINRSTVHRWLEHTEFVGELERMRDHLRANCHQKLLSLVPMALQVLEQDLADASISRALRQKAALEVLDRVSLTAEVPRGALLPKLGPGGSQCSLESLTLPELQSLHEIVVKLRNGGDCGRS